MNPNRTKTSPIIEVIYEDDSLLALNKPSGLHSVRSKRSEEASVADFLLERAPDFARYSPSELDAGLVNRLDRETSGVLIAAKSRDAWDALHATLTEGESTKHYVALVQGLLKEETVASGFIGSEYRRGKKVSVSPHEKARFLAARTNFQALAPCVSSDATLVLAEALTGRRHQIRAHAASIGNPLVGDTLYGATSSLSEIKELNAGESALPTFFLHAYRMRLVHPGTKAELSITAGLPMYASSLQEAVANYLS